jgi:hypothetical protein
VSVVPLRVIFGDDSYKERTEIGHGLFSRLLPGRPELKKRVHVTRVGEF